MAVKRKVEMDLCVRIAGKIECKPKGYKATYHAATVGPVAVSVEYPA